MNPNENKQPVKTPPTATKGSITPAQIKPEMKVVCSNDVAFGVVDHMQGPATIKLKKDDKGVHHYIPLAWIASVDDRIHADRPGDQAMREWSTEPPKN